MLILISLVNLLYNSLKMKIVVFEPHPDDLLFGPGPILLDWIEEKEHDIHIITVTDGRACYRLADASDFASKNFVKLSEEEVTEMRINEAKKAIKFIGIPVENHHFFFFHDADGQKYVKEGIKKAIPLIKDADRIVLPSINRKHIDHQATHDIAIGAAKVLELRNVEYFVYFIASYGRFQDDSKRNQFIYKFTEEKARILNEWLDIYQSQRNLKWTWKMYKWYIKNVREQTYAIYNYDELGSYYNF